ncbi:phage tail domain-containing protein [Planococcus beigongshangi]|uniref:phage tail domain-containing protein n=1 Tax=Planococcus beigongshangi TaxID=2782536 RepID=UPI00193C8075|nr:phage tail domain-containing protein [Planococcus beigongshangi]
MLTIERMNGEFYDLESMGLRISDFSISSPEYVYETAQVDGLSGLLVLETTVLPRILKCLIKVQGDSIAELIKKRDLIFRIFRSKEPFYLTDKNAESLRWKVKCDGAFDLQRVSRFGTTEVHLVAFSPYSETVTKVSRKFNTASFVFNNLGTEEINMRSQTETEIIFRGTSNNLAITNLSTGEVWKYNGSTLAKDEIKLIGVRSFKNKQSIFRNTNKELISFIPGNNEFEISGADEGFEILISSRFYFT